MKKFIVAILLLITVSFLLPVPVYADMLPKQGVVVNFSNVNKREMFVTLLCKYKQYGPHLSVTVDENLKLTDVNAKDNKELAYYAFAIYARSDEFYFNGVIQECSEYKEFSWTYYSPETFKILCYFPQTDTYAVSEIYSQYAFMSYFSVDLGDVGDLQSQYQITAENDYKYGLELLFLLVRIAITVGIELAIALPFGLIRKQYLVFLLILNVITQGILNLGVNVFEYFCGPMAWLLTGLLLEIFVFIIEGIACARTIPKIANKYNLGEPKGKITLVAYSFLANLCSLVIGFFVGLYIIAVV